MMRKPGYTVGAFCFMFAALVDVFAGGEFWYIFFILAIVFYNLGQGQ